MSEPIGGGRGGGGAGSEPPGDPPPPPVPRGFAMVAADADAEADAELHLGDSELPPRPTTVTLLRRTSRTLTESFRRFYGLSLVVHSPLLLIAAATVGMGATGMADAPTLMSLSSPLGYLAMPLSLLTAAALVQAVFESLRGGRTDVAHSARVALRRLGPVLGVAILVSLATAGGCMLCIVPGIVVMAGLFVATPALLVERIGVSDALSRSWKLVSGYKLSIFGLLLLILVIELGFGVVLTLAFTRSTEALEYVYLLLPAQLLLTTFTTTLRGVAAVVAYHDIRQFREGLDEGELAAVFE